VQRSASKAEYYRRVSFLSPKKINSCPVPELRY
jgi:hypothetical protein